MPLRRILDAGSGAGILGVCASGALIDAGAGDFHVRAQDRDELGRVFTEYNARRNGIGPELLIARAEPLLAGEYAVDPKVPEADKKRPFWDLIMSNVPAKAGLPVLEDFIRRSAFLVNPGGRVLVVVVNTLAGFFEERIKREASLIRKAEGPGHTVFLYGNGETKIWAFNFSSGWKDSLLKWNPAYLRNSSDYEMEKISYHLETVYGAEAFDRCCGETAAAAKLAARLEDKIRSCLEVGPAPGAAPQVLVWEGDQGHFPAWFSRRFGSGENGALNFVLAGRNILALEAALLNTVRASGKQKRDKSAVVIASCLYLDREKIFRASGKKRFSFLAVFPKAVPQTERTLEFWEALSFLAAPGAIVIAGLPSAGAEKFDRKKPKAFTRLADIRRDGFRALAYKI